MKVEIDTMQTIFLILVLLHGVIHLLGFGKGIGLISDKTLSLPISISMGVIWLLAAVMLWVFAYAYYSDYTYAWAFGLIAVLCSQILVFAFWKDAKWGTIPNILILIVTVLLYGQYQFQQLVRTETIKLWNQNSPRDKINFTDQDIGNLPTIVQVWMQNSGALDRQYIQIGEVHQVAELQMNPEEDNWIPATAIQYTTLNNPGFIWSVTARMNKVFSVQGRDYFVDGKGHMLIKLLSLISIVDERGFRIDEGSLQRFLGEMVWFPTMALMPYITWEEIDETKARATMEYQGVKGSGIFHFNENGDVLKFTALRYKDNVEGAKRYEWIMNILDYRFFEGVKVPSLMTSTWNQDEGAWTWLKLEVKDIKYNHHVVLPNGH